MLGVILASTEPWHGISARTAPAASAHHTEKAQLGALVRRELSLPEPPATPSSPDKAEPTSAPQLQTVSVQPGDSLWAIFNRLGLREDLGAVLDAGGPVRRLERIHPGETLRLRVTDSGLQRLAYDLDGTRRLHVTRSDDGFRARIQERPMELRFAHAMGTINSSLFRDGREAGLSDKLIMQLAKIFGWDIDFALDLRRGDRFTVIYEERYRKGAKIGDGSIIAAEFINRGKRYRAVRYTDPEGRTRYYTPEGRSMRKPFLRTPVEFTRISSRFDLNRKHPILGGNRPHTGVDYAAPTGTPIRAAGDGRVTYRGRKGGYGNAVILKHGAKYSTLYGHMSRFARDVRRGDRVQQGDTIGYVGMTGLATGPHLHYEFRVDGVHKDPLKVELPDAEPLPSQYMADFRETVSPRLSRLDLYKRTMLAASGDDSS